MKKYYGIDWLRAIACVGIMVMHVYTNNTYAIYGFIPEKFMPSLMNLVYLFMAISAFGMCYGYYEKVMAGKVNWTDFYKKRYGKVLPFFLFLIIVDLVINYQTTSLYEAFTEATLLHGFVPHTFTVIGVAWFLGVVYIFYLIFPFFCVLLENKPRAWCAFAISILLNYLCTIYFDVTKSNFLYSLCFFLAGGLVFLYRDALAKIKWYIYLPVIVISVALYFLVSQSTITRLPTTIALLGFAISIRNGNVRVIRWLSDISMEFYLCHMVAFRAIEKLRLNTRFGNGWGQFLITNCLVFAGTVIISVCWRVAIKKTQAILAKRNSKQG